MFFEGCHKGGGRVSCFNIVPHIGSHCQHICLSTSYTAWTLIHYLPWQHITKPQFPDVKLWLAAKNWNPNSASFCLLCKTSNTSKCKLIRQLSHVIHTLAGHLVKWLQAHGVYEGTYWDLLANIGELTEALTQMAVGPTVLEEPVLQLPPSPTLPPWDTFKPVLQPLPPLPQVQCSALLCSAVM